MEGLFETSHLFLMDALQMAVSCLLWTLFDPNSTQTEYQLKTTGIETF